MEIIETEIPEAKLVAIETEPIEDADATGEVSADSDEEKEDDAASS